MEITYFKKLCSLLDITLKKNHIIPVPEIAKVLRNLCYFKFTIYVEERTFEKKKNLGRPIQDFSGCPERGTMEYHHTQFGSVVFIVLLAAMMVIIIVPLNIGVFPPVLFAVIAILAISLILFYSLNIEISHNVLVCCFGIGFIRKRIFLSDIEQVRSVKNPWFAGWGIHWMPGQYWLWNVSGLRAVELLLKNGSRFRIGTDEPEALIQAIEANKVSAAS